MKIEPVFAYGFPKDKMDELQRAQLELQMKLGSRREIMERMGKQNIPELLEEIDEDAMQQGLWMAKIQELATSMSPNADMGNMSEQSGGSAEEDDENYEEE